MELIKFLWIVIFFLFSLTLLFVWSKLYIISKKAKSIASLLGDIESLGEKEDGLKQKAVSGKQTVL